MFEISLNFAENGLNLKHSKYSISEFGVSRFILLKVSSAIGSVRIT